MNRFDIAASALFFVLSFFASPLAAARSEQGLDGEDHGVHAGGGDVHAHPEVKDSRDQRSGITGQTEKKGKKNSNMPDQVHQEDRPEHDEIGEDGHPGHGHSEGHEENGSHQHGHDGHAGGEYSPDKAITKVEREGERFQLNEKAEKALRISTAPVKAMAKGRFLVPQSALVSFQDEFGVYVKRGKEYSLLKAGSVARKGDHFQVVLNGADSMENIVISGVALLRVAHLQASGQGGEGHVH